MACPRLVEFRVAGPNPASFGFAGIYNLFPGIDEEHSMNFQIRGLQADLFDHLFGKSSHELAELGVERMTVDSDSGYPCRVSLRDAEVGATVLLMNFEHQPADSPYRSSHAIFVREGARAENVPANTVPQMLRTRLISARAFDDDGMMVDADVADGTALKTLIERMLSSGSVSYLHLHNAKHGCFLARADRVSSDRD